MTPTPRRQARDAFTRRLLEVAHRHLVEQGASGLGMRALARDLEVTPGALYRYVNSRDDLLTLLIVDAYESLGKAVEEAEGRIPRGDHEGRWVALWHATRTWALEHRNEYGLIYGTPVPGYQAPPETIPAASRISILLARIASDMRSQAGTTPPPDSPEPGPALREDLARVRHWISEQGMPGDVPDELILIVLRGWTELFGCINMELFGHYVGSVENGAAFLDELAHRSFKELQDRTGP